MGDVAHGENADAWMRSELMSDAGLLRSLLDNIDDGVYFTDRQRKIHYWNPAAERLSGFKAEEVVGHHCADNILMHVDAEGHQLCTSAHCPLVKCFQGETCYVERVYMHHKEGHRVPVKICASPIRNSEGEIIGGIETFHDVTAEIAALQEVETLKDAALLCPLTGVGNRRYCDQVLRRQIGELTPGSPSTGVLFLDVDNFKTFNDRYGHEVGDVVLKLVARTLSKDLRAFDFVGRWDEEEFMIVLPRMLPRKLEETAAHLCKLIESTSVDISKGKLPITVSIGATMVKPGENPEEVVARADRLMYHSKQHGKNRVTAG